MVLNFKGRQYYRITTNTIKLKLEPLRERQQTNLRKSQAKPQLDEERKFKQLKKTSSCEHQSSAYLFSTIALHEKFPVPHRQVTHTPPHLQFWTCVSSSHPYSHHRNQVLHPRPYVAPIYVHPSSHPSIPSIHHHRPV
jgi:hypothetical protein